ncbi:hypothetical protein APHAL10511_005662 [Amanita phalloides]|nr:hypothetical protein APHAL10511_005662 [Amanita phalloides]
MTTEVNLDAAINQAISRVREQSLCPRRIWAIALNLPGRESNIPALVPDERLHMNCSSKHSFCSTGPSHQNCTFDFCEISAVNFTNVVQLHRPGCDQNCKKKDFPIHLLDKPAEENRPTAWAIDGKRPLEPGEPYMAISHVWSDGTGGNGSVNECLYAFFCDVARDLKCKGLWWDAICIPQDKRARAKAINRMHEYYSQATCTIVHDLCLATSEWAGPDHASFVLVMSNWFTRGWTALELARSKKVEVLFNASKSPGYLRKNLDDDIMSRPGTVSSSSRSVASAAIRALRGVNEKQINRQLTVNDILTSLGPRFTSWARDRAVITGLFIGIESLANDQHEIYQQVIRKIGRITAGQLFHSSAALDGAFAWFPSNLFDLPVASESSETLQVTEDGEIVGQWRLMHTLSEDFDPGLSLDSFFFWDMVHPLTECYVRDALKSFDHHIILGERNVDTHTRGLLVKVMKSEHRGEILCSYVGPVYFRKVDLEPVATITVRIGSGGLDLGKGVNAIEYIRRKHRPDQPVPERPMFSVGPAGIRPMPGWWDRGTDEPEEDTGFPGGSQLPIADVGPGGVMRLEDYWNL